MAGDRVLTVRIAGDAKGAVGAIGAVQGKSVGLGKSMLKMGGILAGINFGANLVRDFVDVGKSYTTAMNVMQVSSKATEKEMDAVGEKAKELGGDLTLPGISAADAAQAMTEVVKSGFSVQEAMDAAQGSLQLAGAANIDAASAAGIMADALSMFQLEGNKANMVADRLAQVTASVSGEITDTAEAFKNAGPVWSTAGFSVDELSTAIGMLAQNGIRGAEAGTTLKTMIMRLQAPLGRGKEAMNDLGLSIYDAEGNIKSLRQIIGEYSAATRHMTQEERDKTAAMIFGTRAVKGANLTLARGKDAYDKLSKAIDGQAGAAEQAKARNKGFGGAVDQLESQMESLYLIIWDKAAPAMEKITRKAAAGLEAFNDFISAPGDLAQSLNDLDGEALGETVSKALGEGLDKIGDLSGKITGKIGGFIEKVDWVKLGIEAGKAVLPLVIGLAAGIVNAVSDWNTWKQILANWDTILFAIIGIMFAPAKWAAKLAGALRKIPFVGKFLGAAVEWLSKIGTKIKGAIWNFIKGFFGAFWKGFSKGLNLGSGKGIKEVIGFFKGVGKKIVEWGKRLAGNMAKRAFNMAEKFGNFLARHGPKQAVAALRRLKDAIFGFLSSAGSWLGRFGGKLIRGFVGGIRAMISWVMDWIRNLKGRVVGFFAGVGTWLYSAGADLLDGFVDGIMDKVDSVKDTLTGVTDKLTSWKGPPQKDKVLLTPAGQMIMDGFTKGLESRYSHVKRTLTGFTDDMNKAATASVANGLSGLRGSDLRASGTLAGHSGRRGFLTGSNGAPVYVKVDVHGNVIGEQDFAKRVTPTIRKELVKINKRNDGGLFGD